MNMGLHPVNYVAPELMPMVDPPDCHDWRVWPRWFLFRYMLPLILLPKHHL